MKGLFIPEITTELFRNGCLESIEELMTEGKIYDIDYSPWIPCSERLPFSEYGESESVICCLEDGTREILYFNGSNWCYPTGESYPFQEYKTYAVAWMPLPELPGERDNR